MPNHRLPLIALPQWPRDTSSRLTARLNSARATQTIQLWPGASLTLKRDGHGGIPACAKLSMSLRLATELLALRHRCPLLPDTHLYRLTFNAEHHATMAAARPLWPGACLARYRRALLQHLQQARDDAAGLKRKYRSVQCQPPAKVLQAPGSRSLPLGIGAAATGPSERSSPLPVAD